MLWYATSGRGTARPQGNGGGCTSQEAGRHGISQSDRSFAVKSGPLTGCRSKPGSGRGGSVIYKARRSSGSGNNLIEPTQPGKQISPPPINKDPLNPKSQNDPLFVKRITDSSMASMSQRCRYYTDYEYSLVCLSHNAGCRSITAVM